MKKVGKKYMNLRKYNITFVVVIAVQCLVMVFNFWNLEKEFNIYVDSSNEYSVVSKAAINLQTGSDYLTEQVRYFVITRDIGHMKNYFEERDVTKRRETAIEELKKQQSMGKAVDFLESALFESKKLENLEYYAMRLMVDALGIKDSSDFIIPESVKLVQLSEKDKALSNDYKISQAWLLLFSNEYLAEKNMIASYKSMALTEIFNQSQKIHDESFDQLHKSYKNIQVLVIMIFVTGLLFFLSIVFHIIKPLYIFIKNIKENKMLPLTNTEELNILCKTYNEMYMRYSANEVRLKQKAEHDQLTGLINRTALDEIRQSLSKSKDRIALLLIDVDRFKQINDTFGHVTGDQVLKHVADSLSSCFRQTDYVGRTGGDEFVVIMTGCAGSRDELEELIRSKVLLLREKLQAPPADVPAPTVSIGIAINEEGYSDSLYGNADFALYKVKKAGRDGFEIYSEN